MWTSTPGTPSDAALRTIRSARTASCSTAIARHVGCVRAHSIAIEPEPAPTSHNSCPGNGANVDSEIARTSRLVNWPSVSYASSGSPGTRE